MKKRYPLEPLRATRQREKEDAVRTVAHATTRRAAAERSEAALVARGRASEATRRGVIAAEASRGKVRAEDLARLEAYRRHGEALAEEQSAEEQAAARVTAAVRDEEGRGRERLSRAHAEGRVIEEHRARHRAAESARARRAEDEDASDVHAARNARNKERGK